MDEVYLAGDVDSIQDYVFETSSLPQIKGGSELLQRCEDLISGELRQRYGYKVLYCAGGSFLLKVKRDSALQVKREIEQLYRDKTLVVTVSLVHEEGELPGGPLPHRDRLDGWAERLVKAANDSDGIEFHLRIAHLMSHLREAKHSRTTVPFFQALPFGQRCNRCGKRMVVRIKENLGERLCPVCDLRDRVGRDYSDGQTVRGKFNREFWEKYCPNVKVKFPSDLDALVGEHERGYLAFLYADGNDIGRLLRRVQLEDEYEQLSQALMEGTKTAVYEAINAVCGEAIRQRQTWPFDILNIGGDDVTILLHAGYAWEVAVRFLERFECEVKLPVGLAHKKDGDANERITASCAFVVADVKFPIRYMQRLTKALLGQAKHVAKTKKSSAVTFLWLPGPVASEHVGPLLSAYEFRHGTAERLNLLGRPYTLEQAHDLLELSKELASWPHSLRHRWQEILPKGVMISTSLIAYDIARRKGMQQAVLSALERLAKTLSPDGTGSRQLSPPVWVLDPPSRDGEAIWRTALLDALELAELHSMRPDRQREVEE
ncbi:MAG TPA: hypothetical protein VNL95_01540 [Dehalococcoidia bacterium]|nr:hypothetical protein [Dehalococcoidia bacterium]